MGVKLIKQHVQHLFLLYFQAIGSSFVADTLQTTLIPEDALEAKARRTESFVILKSDTVCVCAASPVNKHEL